MDWARLISTIVVALANVGLALAVFLRNRRSIANIAFAAAVATVTLWQIAAFASDQEVFRSLALYLNRITLALAILMGSLLVYFTKVFPTHEPRLAWPWKAFFVSSALVALVTMLTPLAVARVEYESWGTNVIAGPLFVVMALWILLGVGLIVTIYLRKYRRSHGRDKAQLKYLLLGLALFTITALLFGLLLPMATGTYELSSLNTFSSLFLVGFTAYAMIKHRFMDIRLVVMRGVVYTTVVGVLGIALVLFASIGRAHLADSTGLDPDMLFVVFGLAAVFAFQPLRVLLERVTDHWFYRRTYDPQRVLSNLSTAMATMLDLRELAKLLSAHLRSGLNLTFVSVTYFSSDQPYTVGTGPIFDVDLAHTLLIAGEEGKVIFADDPDADPVVVRLMLDNEIRVFVPLLSDNEVLGGIFLGAKLSGEMFSTSDQTFLEILGAEASIAMKNAVLFEERNERVRELSALNRLSASLGRETQLDAVLNRALHQVMRVTSAETGSIMLFHANSDELVIAASEGLDLDVVRATKVPSGEGIAGWVAKNRKALVVVDADSAFGRELEQQGVKSALCVPLMRRDKVIGVLNVSKIESTEGFSRENLKVVRAFAGQLAVAIENAELYVDLENTFIGTIAALAAAVDAKDPYTFGHSSEVTEHALEIAEHLGLSETDRERLRIAAVLHDIGKIGIDATLLHKPGPLTSEEYEVLKEHPQIAANILESLDFLQDVVPLVKHHHERYEGGGYPSGLVGEDIPLGARIIGVADAFNAMTSDRPYRSARPFDEAVKELLDNAGTQFDPDVVDAFLETISAQRARGKEIKAQPGSVTAFPREKAV